MNSKDAMAIIRELLSEPKNTLAWPDEIMELKRQGRRVTPYQLQKAQEALDRRNLSN